MFLCGRGGEDGRGYGHTVLSGGLGGKGLGGFNPDGSFYRGWRRRITEEGLSCGPAFCEVTSCERVLANLLGGVAGSGGPGGPAQAFLPSRMVIGREQVTPYLVCKPLEVAHLGLVLGTV